MKIFVNLFLLLFLLDGGLSLLDELVTLLFAVAPLAELRNLLANVVIVMAVAVYCCLGIDRRLPKRLLLPLIFFVVGCPLIAWVFPALAEVAVYGLLMAAAQFALGMLLLIRFRKPGSPSLMLPPELFASPFFSRKNTLIFCGANLVVIPVALALVALYTVNAYMSVYTAGFMHVDPRGLFMTERVYRHDNRTIRLAGMIHIGEKNYYDDLVGSIAGRTIVLAEGVSDEENRLQERLDYGRVADFLGLTSQETMPFRGRLIDEDELDIPRSQSKAGQKEPSGQTDILRADLDVSAFRPPTILFLDAMGKHLQESPSFTTGLLSLNTWAGKNITPAMNDIIIDDILHRRNREVIRHLGKALDRYDTVVIPWGALHMKEIEQEVLQRGFVLREERARISIDFSKQLLSLF